MSRAFQGTGRFAESGDSTNRIDTPVEKVRLVGAQLHKPDKTGHFSPDIKNVTSYEVYAGKTFDFTGYKNRLVLARARRLSENRSTKHPGEPFGEETVTEIV